MMVVAGSRMVRLGGGQVIAADEADDVVLRLLRHDLVPTEDELHQPPVLLQFMVQAPPGSSGSPVRGRQRSPPSPSG